MLPEIRRSIWSVVRTPVLGGQTGRRPKSRGRKLGFEICEPRVPLAVLLGALPPIDIPPPEDASVVEAVLPSCSTSRASRVPDLPSSDKSDPCDLPPVSDESPVDLPVESPDVSETPGEELVWITLESDSEPMRVPLHIDDQPGLVDETMLSGLAGCIHAGQGSATEAAEAAPGDPGQPHVGSHHVGSLASAGNLQSERCEWNVAGIVRYPLGASDPAARPGSAGLVSPPTFPPASTAAFVDIGRLTTPKHMLRHHDAASSPLAELTLEDTTTLRVTTELSRVAPSCPNAEQPSLVSVPPARPALVGQSRSQRLMLLAWPGSRLHPPSETSPASVPSSDRQTLPGPADPSIPIPAVNERPIHGPESADTTDDPGNRPLTSRTTDSPADKRVSRGTTDGIAALVVFAAGILSKPNRRAELPQASGLCSRWAGWLLALGLIMAGHHAAGQSDQQPIAPLERIAIRTGEEKEAQFVLKESGEPFFVDGFNYIRLRGGDHSTFDADTQTTKGCYDAERAERMFAALSDAGYNTVRVFIIGRSRVNPGIAGDFDSTRELYEPYMRNVLDFLRRATRHRIRVFPTFGDGGMPRNAYYRDRYQVKGHNAYYLTQSGIAARIEHIVSFLAFIKEREPALLPTLLGVQCQNELYLRADQWPFTEKSGTFTAASGKTYDLSETVQRQALMDDGLRYYHRRMVDAVKAVDKELLVAEGVFVPRAVGKDPVQHAGVWPGRTGDERYPPLLTVIGGGALDFLDVHFYRTRPGESVDQAFRLCMQSAGLFRPEMAEIRKNEPVILGEFGAFDSVEKTFEEAVDNMVRVRDLARETRLNGMLFWTYDCFEQDRLYHAAENWELFVAKLHDANAD